MKKMALKWGSKEKIVFIKGGSPKISFKFCSDGICKKAKSLPECQKPAFLTFRGSSNFPGEECRRIPYFIKGQKAILPSKMQKSIKAYQIECFIRKKITNSVESFSVSLSFLFWGERGAGVISINFGYKEGPPPPKNSYKERGGGHHILQELPVKSHQRRSFKRALRVDDRFCPLYLAGY